MHEIFTSTKSKEYYKATTNNLKRPFLTKKEKKLVKKFRAGGAAGRALRFRAGGARGGGLPGIINFRKSIF